MLKCSIRKVFHEFPTGLFVVQTIAPDNRIIFLFHFIWSREHSTTYARFTLFVLHSDGRLFFSGVMLRRSLLKKLGVLTRPGTCVPEHQLHDRVQNNKKNIFTDQDKYSQYHKYLCHLRGRHVDKSANAAARDEPEKRDPHEVPRCHPEDQG
jgi:hypothetical protein